MDPAAEMIVRVVLAAQAGSGIDPALGVITAAALSTIAAITASWLTSRTAGRASRDSAVLQWAAQMQANEQAARAEAKESRDRADRIKQEATADVDRLRAQMEALEGQLRVKVQDLETQLHKATEAATRLTDTLAMVQAEVWRPEPDVSALRRLVGHPNSGVNGRQL